MKAVCPIHHIAYDVATSCAYCEPESAVQRIVRELDAALLLSNTDDLLFVRAWVEKMHSQAPTQQRVLARAMSGQWVTQQEVSEAGLDDYAVPADYEIIHDPVKQRIRLVKRHVPSYNPPRVHPGSSKVPGVY